MRTDRAATMMSSDWVAIRPIVDRTTDACETLPSLEVGKNSITKTSIIQILQNLWNL